MGGRQAVMACFVVSLAFLVYLFGILTMNVRATDWPINRVMPSIAQVIIAKDGEMYGCTTFAVQGWMVTSNHCTTGDSMTVNGFPFIVQDRDVVGDVALLTGPFVLPSLPFGREPDKGDDVLAIGYPVGMAGRPLFSQTLYQGSFQQIGNDPAGSYHVGENFMQGMSGGPIINRRGEVVSMVMAGGKPHTEYQSIGIGVPYQALRRLLLKWKES